MIIIIDVHMERQNTNEKKIIKRKREMQRVNFLSLQKLLLYIPHSKQKASKYCAIKVSQATGTSHNHLSDLWNSFTFTLFPPRSSIISWHTHIEKPNWS